MTTPRDTRRPKEHWDERLALKVKYVHSRDQLALYQERRQSDSFGTWNAISGLREAYCDVLLEEIMFTYCRGDDLDDIRSKYIVDGIDRYVFACEEMDRYRHEPYARPYWKDMLFYPNDVHTVYCMMSWFICFEADPEKLGKIAPYIAKAGKDRLVDTILQRYQPDREVATEDKCGRTFKLLQSVMDVDEAKAIRNLEKYLTNWGKLMSTFKDTCSIAFAGPGPVKTNEELIKKLDTEKNVHYLGFWAWEVALVVRCFGIDDSSFCDHEFYPRDLARYRAGS